MTLHFIYSISLCVQVLAELPSPVTGGTMLTVEDFLQELKCNINIKHRFSLKNSIHAFLVRNVCGTKY